MKTGPVYVKFPPWVQGDGVVKRKDSIGWNTLYPGDVVTRMKGDYVKVGDAVLRADEGGLLSLYPDSQARASNPSAGEPPPAGGGGIMGIRCLILATAIALAGCGYVHTHDKGAESPPVPHVHAPAPHGHPARKEAQRAHSRLDDLESKVKDLAHTIEQKLAGD